MVVLAIIGGISFMAACYRLFIYVGTQHGKGCGLWVVNKGFSVAGGFVLLAHWLPLNFLFLFIP